MTCKIWEDKSSEELESAVKTASEKNEKLIIIWRKKLTELARFFSENEPAKARIKELHIEAGALWQGNASPAAEKNIYEDPEAADYIFNSGLKIYWYPLDIIKSPYDNIGFLDQEYPGLRPENEKEYEELPGRFIENPEKFIAVPTGLRVELSGSITRGKTVNDLFSDKKYDRKNVIAVLGQKEIHKEE